MKTRRRRLIVSSVQYGTPTAGHCSVCNRPFEVELRGAEALSGTTERLVALFEQHVCDEDFSQSAPRVVGEATDR
jgi:hypothetical protein